MRAGAVVAYPTEAVWGLGCDPHNRAALEHILQLKQRRSDMGVILVASRIEQLRPYLGGLTPVQYQQLAASWPGAVTWLVPNNHVAPAWISGGRQTLALRVSDHPVVRALCDAFGGPIVSTSANPHQKPPARSALKVRLYFGAEVDCITPGVVGHYAKPSEIRDLLSGEVRRPA